MSSPLISQREEGSQSLSNLQICTCMCAHKYRLYLNGVFHASYGSSSTGSATVKDNGMWGTFTYLFLPLKKVQAQDKISHDRSEMRSLNSAGERCSLHGANRDRPHGRSRLSSSWTTVADGEITLSLPDLLYSLVL